ncbi:endochitinase-like [Ixodes scapularis]
MENEETTLVGVRGSQAAVGLGDPFINSALVHTGSACLIFFVVFIFVLPGILLTTLKREKPFVLQDMRPPGSAASQQSAGPDRPLVVCMINVSSYNREPPMRYSPDQVPSPWCSHVVFPLSGAADWTEDMLHYDYTHKVTHPNLYRDMVRLKKVRPALRILVSVGDHETSNNLFRYAAETMHSTVQFCSAVLRWTLGNGFDGLVIHHMFTGSTDDNRRGIVILLQKLWVHFERHGLTLVLVFEPETDLFDKPLLGGKICSYVDYAVVVAHGFRSQVFAEFSSPLRGPGNQTFDSAVERAISSGVPVHKLIPSVSFESITYTLDDGSDHRPGSVLLAGMSRGLPGPITKNPGALAYFELCRQLQSGNWTRVWDPRAGCAYAYSGDQWLTFEDEQSLTLKADYVRNRSLAGVMIWDVTSDDYRGYCGPSNILVQTLYENFQKH